MAIEGTVASRADPESTRNSSPRGLRRASKRLPRISVPALAPATCSHATSKLPSGCTPTAGLQCRPSLVWFTLNSLAVAAWPILSITRAYTFPVPSGRTACQAMTNAPKSSTPTPGLLCSPTVPHDAQIIVHESRRPSCISGRKLACSPPFNPGPSSQLLTGSRHERPWPSQGRSRLRRPALAGSNDRHYVARRRAIRPENLGVHQVVGGVVPTRVAVAIAGPMLCGHPLQGPETGTTGGSAGSGTGQFHLPHRPRDLAPPVHER